MTYPREFIEQVDAIRDFNRFYVPRTGLLNRNLTGLFTLTEARIIYELYICKSTTAKNISENVRIDAGYLSRVLQRFEKRKLITKKKSLRDARQKEIMLSAKGRKLYATWAANAREHIAVQLNQMSADQQKRLIAAMSVIIEILNSVDAKPIE